MSTECPLCAQLMWSVCSLEPLKNVCPISSKKEILTHVTTWVTLENTMPSEVSQTQKDKYCMLPLI